MLHRGKWHNTIKIASINSNNVKKRNLFSTVTIDILVEIQTNSINGNYKEMSSDEIFTDICDGIGPEKIFIANRIMDDLEDVNMQYKGSNTLYESMNAYKSFRKDNDGKRIEEIDQESFGELAASVIVEAIIICN